MADRHQHGGAQRWGPSHGLRITAEDPQVGIVLWVDGALDGAAAPDVAGVLDVLVGRSRLLVVVDLSGCDFLDLAGVRALAGTGRRTRPGEERQVRLRAPTAAVRRVLQRTGLSSMVTEPVHASTAPTGPAATAVAELLGGWAASGRLVPVIDSALELVTTLALATLDGADGASISLQRDGRLVTVAATNSTVRDMDADQYASGQGPCVDASVSGVQLTSPSLLAEERWPIFTAQAVGLGIRSILSSPLLMRSKAVGALNVYSAKEVAFDARQHALATTLAAEASKVLASADSQHQRPRDDERLERALADRQAISVAQGVLMERHAVEAMEAHATMRRNSARSGVPLADLARAVVGSVPPHGPPPEPGPR